VWHGTDKIFDRPKEDTFFSSSKDFAKNYGKNLYRYILHLYNPFDSLKRSHLDKLFKAVIEIEDPYDGKIYRSSSQILNKLASDTWEALEPLKNDIKAMGYDSVIIYEGGIKNYLVFSPSPTAVIKASIISKVLRCISNEV